MAQQLITAGETVVDAPATLAARTRLLSSNRSHKNDPNDATSVAITALRHASLRQVHAVGDAEQLRLLAKRNDDIGRQRSRVASRLHALLVELVPGGIRREIYATAVDELLARVPLGVEHQPFAAEEAELLLIEPSGTPNTGDPSTATERVVI